MFTVHCPVHERIVLVFPSGIDRIVNGPEGPRVHYHCTCGHRGVWAPPRPPAPSTGDQREHHRAA